MMRCLRHAHYTPFIYVSLIMIILLPLRDARCRDDKDYAERAMMR